MVSLVSVVIPLYNAQSYIAAALDSILNQTYSDLEVVVVDDGSTDDGAAIARDYDERVRLIKQTNQGAAAARNNGIKHAKGKWIAFLDADDTWEPYKLEEQVKGLSGNKWSYCDSTFVGGINSGKRDSELNNKPSGEVFDKLVKTNFIGTSGVLIEKVVLDEVGGFDSELRSIQDWDLWLRVAAKYPISYLKRPGFNYRVHASSTSRGARKTLPNHLKVIERSVKLSTNLINHAQILKEAKANSYTTCSYIAEEEKDFKFALHCAAEAWRLQKLKKERLVRLAKAAVKYAMS